MSSVSCIVGSPFDVHASVAKRKRRRITRREWANPDGFARVNAEKLRKYRLCLLT
jgi:hypothetical protein